MTPKHLSFQRREAKESGPTADDWGMNAQPDPSVTYLEAVPEAPSSDQVLLATVKELDRKLSEQRAANAALEAQIGEYALALTHQTAQTKHLRVALAEAAARGATPPWKRKRKR